MSSSTKRIAVLYTIINGRKNFVAHHLRPSTLHKGLKMAAYTTEVESAREFDNEVEAENFIPTLVNSLGRVLVPSTELVNVALQHKRQQLAGVF